MTPNLTNLVAFKSMHALCSVGKDGQLKAVFYASCLVSGRDPLWGIWQVSTGRFVRFCSSKQNVADTYAAYTWRRRMAKWTGPDDDARHSDVAARRQALGKEFGPLPKVTPQQARQQASKLEGQPQRAP